MVDGDGIPDVVLNYTRERITGGWDINNPYYRDVDGNQIFLAKEIEDYLGDGKCFRIVCAGTNCRMDFDCTITVPQQTEISAIVAAHKAHR